MIWLPWTMTMTVWTFPSNIFLGLLVNHICSHPQVTWWSDKWITEDQSIIILPKQNIGLWYIWHGFSWSEQYDTNKDEDGWYDTPRCWYSLSILQIDSAQSKSTFPLPRWLSMNLLCCQTKGTSFLTLQSFCWMWAQSHCPMFYLCFTLIIPPLLWNQAADAI